MFCGNCGKPVDDNWSHCPLCGKVIKRQMTGMNDNISYNNRYVDQIIKFISIGGIFLGIICLILTILPWMGWDSFISSKSSSYWGANNFLDRYDLDLSDGYFYMSFICTGFGIIDMVFTVLELCRKPNTKYKYYHRYGLGVMVFSASFFAASLLYIYAAGEVSDICDGLISGTAVPYIVIVLSVISFVAGLVSDICEKCIK